MLFPLIIRCAQSTPYLICRGSAPSWRLLSLDRPALDRSGAHDPDAHCRLRVRDPLGAGVVPRGAGERRDQRGHLRNLCSVVCSDWSLFCHLAVAATAAAIRNARDMGRTLLTDRSFTVRGPAFADRRCGLSIRCLVGFHLCLCFGRCPYATLPFLTASPMVFDGPALSQVMNDRSNLK